MKQTVVVFNAQRALFFKDRGMLLFYLAGIPLVGLLAALLQTGLVLTLTLTTVFLTPLLADSLAGEREKKTLESLLASRLSTQSLVWGKALFCFAFSAGYALLCLLCEAALNSLSGRGAALPLWQWGLAAVLLVLHFFALCLIGVSSSAKAESPHLAYGKIAKLAYPLGLLLCICFAAMQALSPLYAVVAAALSAVFYLALTGAYAAKTAALGRAAFFEGSQGGAHQQKGRSTGPGRAAKTQFGAVLRHEARYCLKYPAVLRDLALLCFMPGALLLTIWLLGAEPQLDHAVLLIALMIPRAPTNLAALSIGGEKAYKTGESLLATPLGMRPMFLGKSAVAVLVSSCMLALSAPLALLAANTLGVYAGSGPSAFTAGQLMLIFPAGILSSIAMVFITGILSMRAKTPRGGLYISSSVGLLFALPPVAIVYGAGNRLLWAALYCAALLLADLFCAVYISARVTRPQLMRFL